MNVIKMKDVLNNDVALSVDDMFKAIMLDSPKHDDLSVRFYRKELDLCIIETLDRLYKIRCKAADDEYNFLLGLPDKIKEKCNK